MPEAGVVRLTETTCPVGHDGRGDGRLGDYPGPRSGSMTVLCGHTRGSGGAQILPGLRELTAGAVNIRPGGGG